MAFVKFDHHIGALSDLESVAVSRVRRSIALAAKMVHDAQQDRSPGRDPLVGKALLETDPLALARFIYDVARDTEVVEYDVEEDDE